MAKSILIVDDEPHIRHLLDIFLKKNGFEVALASSAEEGLDIVSVYKNVDLVILDNRMPGIQGADIIDRLRNSKQGIRVILLTGSIGSVHANINVDAYMRKPVDLNKLLETINNLLLPA